MKKYDFYEDPGHGWLKVPRRELEELDLLQKISVCSYQRGDFVFLEEDADASLFIEAKKLDMNNDFRNHIANKQSRIRNYERFNPEKKCNPPNDICGKDYCEKCDAEFNKILDESI